MVSHHPAKFGDHRHCGNGDMFLVRKIPDALASVHHYCSICHYCLFLKDMNWKQTAYHINSDPGHTCSNQQFDKTLKITFASLSRKSDQKEKTKEKKLE